MLPDRVLNPEPLALESDALPTVSHGPTVCDRTDLHNDGVWLWLHTTMSL